VGMGEIKFSDIAALMLMASQRAQFE
jgi:hypothetical protein